MMRMPLFLTPLALLATSACSTQEEAAPGPAEPTVYEIMTELIDPDADAIWEIGNNAITEEASIDPGRMSDEDWARLAEAARSMAADSRTLAALDPVVVTRPGVQIADEGVEGAPTPAAIQEHIERDEELFRNLARSLATHADELVRAAETRDAAAAGRLINELDGVCESCHLEFWYPEQKALMEEMGIEAQ